MAKNRYGIEVREACFTCMSWDKVRYHCKVYARKRPSDWCSDWTMANMFRNAGKPNPDFKLKDICGTTQSEIS